MPELSFTQIDAFADRPFTGNQAAVMPMDAFLDDATLQAIAAENNLAETAFIVKRTDSAADFDLRWFTPTVEVEMCGHATLASGHWVLSREPERREVRFLTRHVGVLTVARDNDALTLNLPAWATEPRDLPDFARAMGGTPTEIRRTTTAVEPSSLAVYATADEVRALAPDVRTLGAMGEVLAIATAPGDGGHDVVSRVFAPGAGIDEDPVTGAAHAILVPYWAEKLGRHRFTAFQASKRGGLLECTLQGDRVILGGRCVTVIEGTFRL